VLMTHPNSESKAKWHLESQSFTTYLPKLKHRHWRNGQCVVTPQLLFPRYLFVMVRDVWRGILGTIGVAMLLRDAEQPAKLPAKFVDELRSSEGSDGMIDLRKPRWSKGQRLRVKYGHLKGQIVLYDGMGPKEREMALLNAMGRSISITLESDNLEVA
jgi:transcription antitermination factor NusG